MNLINRDEKVIAGIEKIRFSPIAPIGGDGCYLIEENGRRLLDFAGSQSWGPFMAPTSVLRKYERKNDNEIERF